ncbi:hypothetical protein HCN44_001418 [Aphidius gifuensis]|uniref:Apolipophorin n=2 Tax=Aphidius gifuensis TaxID=684658 RepID=A0A834XTC4_APHGI|nr:hypothetical protein HCN44_001418 [Aphidius gifuensis]
MQCKVGGTAKFKYTEGTIYRYHHSVNVSLNLGRDSTSSNLYIESTVSIEFLSACEADLRITESSINQYIREKYETEFPDRAESEFKEKLEKYSLRFAFEDGHVHELCPSKNEAIWALNIKRGILSMLQNTMKRFDVDHKNTELDVNGICDTTYRLHEARKTSLIVNKIKDLAGCTNRGKHLSILQSYGYNINPRSRAENNLLKSTTNCEIVIDHNIYQSVTCKESHLFRPLSNGNAAAQTTIHSSIVLFEESPKTFDEFFDDDQQSSGRDTVPTNLLYDHSSEITSVTKTSHGELRTSIDLLKSMCSLGSGGQLDQTFSESFTKFIYSARYLDYPSLSQLLARANGLCFGGKKHILDALPFIGSSAAIKVMRDMMIKRTIDHERSNSWMTAIALVPRPDIETVSALLPLLEIEREIPEAHLILIYSSVVRAFCENEVTSNKWKKQTNGFFIDNNCLAIKETGIEKFISRLEDTIEKGCSPRPHESDEDNRRTLEALKAIGNMGIETKKILKLLQVCVEDEGSFLSMDIKIAAIEAHRRLPSCQATRDELFLPYYRNFTLDPEFRIASYLQVMRCPDYNVVKVIKTALRDEPVNQVGSFVWSHLTNLLESSSPTRIEIQSLLSDRDLGDKFNSDARKYSRNYETSFFSEEYNVGGTMQINVVFSAKSYVPRTLTMNMSLDLFGESVNVLETSVRLEGIEHYAEKFFGPNGPLANEKMSKYMAGFIRSLRSVPQDSNIYLDGVKQLPNVIDNNFDDPKITYSYKIFGNELEFKTLRGVDDIAMNLAALDPWMKMKKILSGKEIRFEKTGMFLDVKYVVPSTVGLPVKLDVAGSAACNFKLSGMLDTDKFATKSEINLVGNIAPSVSVDLTGKMTIDAIFKSAGIKLRSNVYSSGAVNLTLNIKGVNLVRLNVELPNKQLEVFSAKTDIVFISTSGAESMEKPVITKIGNRSSKASRIENTTCSWPVLERLIGLKMCVDYQFPNVTDVSDASYFVLNGPTLFRTSVIKADPTAESYLFEYKWNATPTESVMRLAFDTPGSRINRESSIMVSFDGPNRNVSVLLRSAGNSFVAKGTYKRTDNEAMIDVGLDINGTQHLHAHIGYSRKKVNYGYTYSPRIYLGINNERILQLNGTIRDASKNNISQCDIDLNFETKKVTSKLIGYVMRRNTSLTGNIKLEYQLKTLNKKETLQIEIALHDRSTKNLSHNEAHFELQSSAYPELNAIIDSWYKQAIGHLELHLEINTKPHLRDDKYKLTAQAVLTYSKAYFQSQEARVNAFISINKPIQNLDIKFEIQRVSIGPHSKTFIMIRYAPGKEITLAVNLIIPRGNMLAIEGHANMTIPNYKPMIINIKITEKAKKEYDIDFYGSWFSGHNATIKGMYADRSTAVVSNGSPKIISHNLKLVLRSPSIERDILINCKFYRDHANIKVDINIEHLDSDKYALKIEHSILTNGTFSTSAKAKYRNTVYAILINVDVQREIRLELQLDRWRDVHLILTGINDDNTKTFGIEIKWDANRDPELKFIGQFQFDKYFQLTEQPITKNLTGSVMISYPGRLLTGSCHAAIVNYKSYILDTKIVWDPLKAIKFDVEIDFDPNNWRNQMRLNSYLLTPFEMWQKTSINIKYKLTEQQFIADFEAFWQDTEKFLIQMLLSSVESPSTGTVEYNANCGLSSTVHLIGWLTINMTHIFTKLSNQASVDTRFLVNYHPDKIINLRSVWNLKSPDNHNDNFTLTGNLRFISPLSNYKNGDVKCQLSYSSEWKFDGTSSVEIDLRRYTGILRGDIARIKESMIQFNITTPIEKYSFLKGEFGLSESDRHVVAQVTSPSGPIGIEALCQLFTITNHDFNVMLKISTPIEFLQKFLILAKMGKTENDFRISYNNITAGFQAIWHYNNITDFHYSYILFTPIHGFHESGVVAKLIINDSSFKKFSQFAIDTEFSIKIVETKLGLSVVTGPKPIIYQPKIIDTIVMTKTGQVDEDNLLSNDDFEWHGDVEINLAVIETVIGHLNINKDDVSYQISGILILPPGKILIDDKLIIKNLFDMKNVLQIKTPFSFASIVDSNYVFNFNKKDSIYFTTMEVNVLQISDDNSTLLVGAGYTGNYSFVKADEDDSVVHHLQVSFKTPFEILEYLDGHGVLEVDENIYKSSIEIHTNNSNAEMSGSLEFEESFFDGTIVFGITSDVLTIPTTRINVKKDLAEVEKKIEAEIEIKQLKNVPCKVQGTWLFESEEHVEMSIGIETWVPSLRQFNAGLIYLNKLATNENAQLDVNIKIHPDDIYNLTASYEPSQTFGFKLQGPQDIFYKFNGEIESSKHITGQLKNINETIIYLIDGNYDLNEIKPGGVLFEVNTKLLDSENNIKHNIKFDLTREIHGIKLKLVTTLTNASLSFNYANAFNWDTNIDADLLKQNTSTGEFLKIEKWSLKAFANVPVNGNASIYLRTESPLIDLENMEISGNLMLSNDSGDARLRQNINNIIKRINVAWKLSYMIDMFIKSSGSIDNKDIGVNIYFKNPLNLYRNINFGFDLNANKWKTSTNTSFGYKNNENIDVVILVKLPPPDDDNHQLLLSYHGDNGVQNKNYIIGYNSIKGKLNYITDGSIKMTNKSIDGHFRLCQGSGSTEVVINNILNATFEHKKIGINYSLYTPKFAKKKTVNIVMHYDGSPIERNIIDIDIFYPGKKQIGKAHISYESLVNVNGTLNATTSMPKFQYAACNFIVLTTLKKNMRFVQFYWPNDTALFASDYTYHSEKLDSNLEGIIKLEVPLSTRHIANLNYGYKKRPLVTTGYSKLIYNNNSILEGTYDSKSESRAGFEKEHIIINLKNSYHPLAIDYVNQFEYSAGNFGTNYPNLETKKIRIYKLDNHTAFDIAGESKIRTTHEGQDIYLTAIHLNRTVKLNTDYKILPGEFDNNFWISLADDAWASYKINIVNKTTEDIDNQFIILNIAYPRKKFTFDGSYFVTSREFNTDGKLSWNKTSTDYSYDYSNGNDRERTIGAGFIWKNLTDNNDAVDGPTVDRQMAQFSLKHPGLTQDTTLSGYLVRHDGAILINTTILANYSDSPDKLLSLTAIIKNESTSTQNIQYSYSINGKHPKTRLELDMFGHAGKVHLIKYETNHRALYRRSFLPEESGKLFIYLNIPENKFEFDKKNNELIKHLDIMYSSTDTEYKINGSAIDTVKSLNSTGEFYLNVDEKLTWMMVNYTPDAIESLRMYGNIPNARNAVFDVWRTYDRDLLISDVAFYVKLNHSRLVTSMTKWRPDLKNDIVNLVKDTVTNIYNEIGNDADYWKQYLRTEGMNALSEVWDDARDDLDVLIDDWENLKELDDDLELLKIYLNDSYNANDFYVKDVVAVGLYVIDEMSLRSHIESLPNILNEIWEIMGESGEAIRKSLVWIIETTKAGYKKLSEIVSAILKGESYEQISSIIEKIVEKYDKFMKDLHVAFIKYMENLWSTFYRTIYNQWNKTLKMIEPAFIRVLHYLEAVAWKISEEVSHFLYDRQNELIKSPYFNRFTNLTQDVDKFYRDIKNNDIITNIRKYSAIIVSFIKERYFSMVPFGQELKDLVDEIITELSELKKLPSINYTYEKINYLIDQANYFYQYFGIKSKIEYTVRIIHLKLITISQTALQTESKYREAKTKFIFDPDNGIMCLEQKLPMSWHAFNQTPEFQEIPEYRTIVDMRNYFTISNSTFWNLYYRYRPYTDPYNWLPPFKAQAMIIGYQHLVTFDGLHIDFVGKDSYLLAADFVNNDFSVLINYEDENNSTIRHKIIVLTGKQIIQIDVFRDSVELGNSGRALHLPLKLDNNMGFVYQEESIVTVELKNGQFKLKCNLKYDVCIIELSGWYFGKTAGLLGTMNNEKWDDTLSSNGRVIIDNIKKFAKSWSLPSTASADNNLNFSDNLAIIGEYDYESYSYCKNLFLNSSSEFVDCFAVIDTHDYAVACKSVRSISETCTLAIGYMQICGFYNTYLRIPDTCTSCPMMIDGTTVAEGEFIKLENTKVPKSTDIVFIVEAKSCNNDIKRNRSIDQVIAYLNKEFNDNGIKDNRWSLVTFGGDDVYDKPRSLILDNKIFTNSWRFPDYFDNIKIGNGNQDIFSAIGFATQLVFRAGVSKTFILMPCSHCEQLNQTLDYSVINQVLLEHDIRLHILMDGDFNFQKSRINKIFYGLDATKGYTRKDSKILSGDVDLRRQVKLSKSALGYCTPLALESNGTIFSGNKLKYNDMSAIKKFASVFAKRVASTAVPNSCQNCECTANNDGVTHMECIPCIYPMPTEVDYVTETFDEDDGYSSAIQQMDTDYVQVDQEED